MDNNPGMYNNCETLYETLYLFLQIVFKYGEKKANIIFALFVYYCNTSIDHSEADILV